MELRSNIHHVFRLMRHSVWIPKYRLKIFFEPYRADLKSIIYKIGYDYDIEIVELEAPTDHIHMVIRAEPKGSPAAIMQKIKSISAREFFRLHSAIKKMFLGWGIMDSKLPCRIYREC